MWIPGVDEYVDEDEREDEDGVKCNRCGMQGLTLLNTGVRWKLFEEKGHKHVCRALDSDFEDLTSPPHR